MSPFHHAWITGILFGIKNTVINLSIISDLRQVVKLKLAISACLLGQKVRHDGNHKKAGDILEFFSPYCEFIAICPEMEIGLGSPRNPIQIDVINNQQRLIMPNTGEDLSEKMSNYATSKFKSLIEDGICGFILKSNSPSCGLGSVLVHDNGKVSANENGFFSRYLKSIPLREESDLHSNESRQEFLDEIRVNKAESLS